jgi:hypothetical protein
MHFSPGATQRDVCSAGECGSQGSEGAGNLGRWVLSSPRQPWFWIFYLVVQPDGQEVDLVAAMQPGNQQGTSSWGGGRGGSRVPGGHGTARHSGAAHEPEASKEATLVAGMRFKHWRYGWYILHPSLQVTGKRQCRGQLNAFAPGEPMHLSDKLSDGAYFLKHINLTVDFTSSQLSDIDTTHFSVLGWATSSIIASTQKWGSLFLAGQHQRFSLSC